MTVASNPDVLMTVRDLLEWQARERGDAVYAVFPETQRELTFGALLKSAKALARFLSEQGAHSGERIAFLLPNGLQALQLFIGIQAAGAVAVPLSLLALAPQLAFVLEHAQVRHVFVGKGQRTLVDEATRLLGAELKIIEVDSDSPAEWEAASVAYGDAAEEGSSVADAWPWVPPVADGDSLLMYTSGTTGRPKGVRLTGSNLLAGARFVSDAHALTASDRVLAVLPLYHINAQVVTVLGTLWHGGSLVMPQRFSTSLFWQQAYAYRCTWLNVVPTIVAYLLAGSDRVEKAEAPWAIRFCRSASAPLAPDLQTAFEQRFGIGIIETMGLTETAAPCFSNPLDPQLRRIGSPGKPFGNLARIADVETGDVLGNGQTGEIQIQGANVMPGYLNAPEENAKAFTADGWLRTGDLGHRDTDGFYFVTGRLKELIIKGGENISPREIDEALLSHPAVLEAAAVGVPDPQYGQQIEAAVVLRSKQLHVSESELRQWCAERVGPFKTPQRVYFVDELPKGPSGKVQRLRLLGLSTEEHRKPDSAWITGR